MCARTTDGRVFATGADAPTDAPEAPAPVADRKHRVHCLESLGLSLRRVEGETPRRPAVTPPAAAS
eukprot:7799342-Pyramimonas_sp.AAC.1